jgi:catechol 2,3-dioxygenase-like lactoylglutathione lyase family enzyme
MIAPPPLVDLPPLSQIGFVVPDMAAALAAFTPLYGPFQVERFENKDFDFRGRPADSVLECAFGYTGTMEIEIIQPISGDGPHRAFLESGRSGMHHLQYRFDNLDDAVARLRAAGYECIWSKRPSPTVALAYMSRPDFPLVLELVEPKVRVPPSENW